MFYNGKCFIFIEMVKNAIYLTIYKPEQTIIAYIRQAWSFFFQTYING